MSATVKDVAKLAGVSPSTVSRVMNNDPRISDTTRERVIQCMNTLDYKINHIARSLKTNRTYTIGFICPEIPNDFFMRVAKGVEDELRKQGYSVIICCSNENEEEEAQRFRLMMKKCVDGLIIIPVSSESAAFQSLAHQDIPVVLVDRLVKDYMTDAVLVDNIHGSYTAIEYLIGQGYRRIAFISGDMRTTSAQERYEGYRRALADYCISQEEELMKFGDYHSQSGYQLMKELMEQPLPPDSIFISNYFMHLGAVRYLVENRKKLQHEVFISSFDDMELFGVLGFPSIHVEQPVMEIGSKAAEILLHRIQGDKTAFPGITRLKTRLITKR